MNILIALFLKIVATFCRLFGKRLQCNTVLLSFHHSHKIGNSGCLVGSVSPAKKSYTGKVLLVLNINIISSSSSRGCGFVQTRGKVLKTRGINK